MSLEKSEKNPSRLDKPVTIYFKNNNKLTKTKTDKPISLLELAHSNDIPLEGACEGSLACSTCHVYCPNELFRNRGGEIFFKKGISPNDEYKSKVTDLTNGELSGSEYEQISEKEMDLLDKAYKVKENSRLGCQIKVNKEFNDKIFEIPRATVNLAVDGHVPKPH